MTEKEKSFHQSDIFEDALLDEKIFCFYIMIPAFSETDFFCEFLSNHLFKKLHFSFLSTLFHAVYIEQLEDVLVRLFLVSVVKDDKLRRRNSDAFRTI